MREWVLPDEDPAATRLLAAETGLSRITARVLLSRGIDRPEKARRFLQPSLDQLHDPFLFAGMEAAVNRLRRALERNERIGVFGDYDVDGIAGVYVLARGLRLAGADPVLRIPHRSREGFGLTGRAIEEFHDAGVSLLVTIDCGTSNFEEINLARSRAMDVVVVDHHTPEASLPPATTLLNPKVHESGYPFAGLCSGAVALKLIWGFFDRVPAAVKGSERFRAFLIDAFALVALATYADVVPLVDENRVLVRFGLEALRESRRPGLRRLLARLRLDGRPVREFDVLFRIVPRLNAIGRMGDAADAARLLLTDDEREVERILDLAEQANRERQRIERTMLREAVRLVEKGGEPPPAIVVWGRDWHVGVAGIVASRLQDRFGRPAVVLCPDGNRLRGSARSDGELDLVKAIAECGRRIPGLRGGGHPRAAGIELPRARVSTFRKVFEDLARTSRGRVSPLRIDADATLGELTPSLCRELARFEPFGPGNSRPLLMIRDLAPAGPPRAHPHRHVSLRLSDGTRSVRAIAFNQSDLPRRLRGRERLHLVASLQLNHGEPELVVQDVKPAGTI